MIVPGINIFIFFKIARRLTCNNLNPITTRVSGATFVTVLHIVSIRLLVAFIITGDGRC